MDPLNAYRDVVKRVLAVYTKIPYAHGDLRCEVLVDREHHRYALITVGWNGGKRVHFVLVHIDIVGDKVWIEKDTTEGGVAPELVQAGIPKSHIVLAFRPPEVREHTEYAVA
jgi:hypothetical protein